MEQLRGQIGTYRLADHVARGRSGDTYRAEADDGTPVAIKIHDRVDDGQGEIERLARVDHPGVIDLLDHGRAVDGRLWLALPWIDGRSLADVLAARSPLTVEQTVGLLAPLAAAVDALHRAGIIHGDLSPKNVIVGPGGQPTLIDLGASSELDPSSLDETSGLEVTVTPRYASPEVAEGRRPGPASDRYAIGLIAYEALTGAFPFEDVATPIAMLGHHASTEPVAPSEHRPNLAGGAEAALLMALAKDPTGRQPTATAIIDGLATPAPASIPASTRTGGPRRWLRRGAVAVGMLLVAAVALAWLDGRGGTVDREAAIDGVPVGGEPSVGGEVEEDGEVQADSEVQETATAWPAGRAAGLSCNLLQTTDFESGLVLDGFYTGDPTNTTAVVPGVGVDGSAALQVGDAGRFGLYGEIIPLGTADRYVFSAWLRTDGTPEVAAIYIDFLDADYAQLTAVRDRLVPDQLLGSADGTRHTVESEAPEGAAFAVPTVFKDGSPSTLLVDEVVFGPSETCLDLAS